MPSFLFNHIYSSIFSLLIYKSFIMSEQSLFNDDPIIRARIEYINLNTQKDTLLNEISDLENVIKQKKSDLNNLNTLINANKQVQLQELNTLKPLISLQKKEQNTPHNIISKNTTIKPSYANAASSNTHNNKVAINKQKQSTSTFVLDNRSICRYGFNCKKLDSCFYLHPSSSSESESDTLQSATPSQIANIKSLFHKPTSQ